MEITNKDIRRLSIIAMILLLFVLAFLVLRPILLSVLAGLLLGYAFLPVYNRVLKIVKERNTAAVTVCAIILIIVFLPLWFLIPLIIQQAFDSFAFAQSVDIRGYIETFFPAATDQFKQDITASVINFIGDISSYSLNLLVDFLLDLPNVLLQFAVILFVFFFTLRDREKLVQFVSEISPLRKEQQKALAKKFKAITNSIIFGYVVVGLIQGIATGVGLLIFGVPHALVLTIIAILASVIPILGPWLIWVPAAVYLFATGSILFAILFAIYSAFFVSLIDNFLRPYIVSRKTGISTAIVLVGMIGGLFVFGILGIILGPLILAYLIVLLEAYRSKTLAEMFQSD